MRRLCKSVTGMALLAALWVGCGSTGGDDRLIFRFIRFDGQGLTQQDSVRTNSADVDVIQDICSVADGVPSFEPFTQTSINAVFRNEQALDIRLERYRVRVGGKSGLGVFEGRLSDNIPGGRCINVDRSCTADSDCGAGGTCEHAETTVSSIILFDFLAKASVNPEVYGEALTVSVSFFGSDATEQSFQTTANYVVTFADFDHCASSGTGAS